MKITAVILLAACLSAAATGKAQKVSLTLRDAPLEKALKEIKRQTGLDLLYTVDVLQHARPVTIELRNADLRQALDQCFKEQPLTYTIVENVIVVKLRPVTSAEGVGEEIVALPIDVKGRVVDTAGNPVAGASVTVKGDRTKGTTTDENGYFELKGVEENAVLVVSGVNIESYEVRVGGKSDLSVIMLKTKITQGQEVTIRANTGYQEIEPNKSTGSFSVIDNKTLNQQVGTNVLKRLDGITTSVLFDNKQLQGQKKTNITVRGLSSINGPLDPLIVLDGFIYEGDINNINPNIIDEITILKDAAAASIWGARAGNGVIVITTKKGGYNQNLQIGINANVTINSKPDLFYLPQMSSADYIDVEQFLYRQGVYDFALIDPAQIALSPAVEIFNKRAIGLISAADSASLINAFKNSDIRDEYNKYFYTNAISQQYAINLRGGGANSAYVMSLGYDRGLSEVYDKSRRINAHFRNSYRPIKNLEATFDVYYTKSENSSGRPSYGNVNVNGRTVPYLKFTEDSGNPLAIPFVLRQPYTDTVGGGMLLNWNYFPLEDYKHNRISSDLSEVFANVGIRYSIAKSLSTEFKYQYQRQQVEANQIQDNDSYEARNLVNLFSQLDYATGTVTRIIPEGGIKKTNNNNTESQTLRGQINFDQKWGIHRLIAIVGGEVRKTVNTGHTFTTYGYNEDPLSNGIVDFLNSYPTFIDGSTAFIPGAPFNSPKLVSKFASLYANLAYDYNEKYILSISSRKDGSNIFGANTNDKWKPLWSAGLAWNISNEGFYKSTLFPTLRIRATFGYSGNVDLSKTPVPIAGYSTFNHPLTNLRFGSIGTLNNPDLRWEQVRTINFAVEFALKNRILTGSIDYYLKRGIDLYGPAPFDYTAWGDAATIIKNVAGIKGNGLEITLNTKNIDKKIKWNTTLLFTLQSNKTSDYFSQDASKITRLISNGDRITPVIGKPLYALAAYRWGGLNDQGNPVGFVDGQNSTDYLAIIKEAEIKGVDGNVVYIGSALPTKFGSVINTFGFNNFSLSINLTYKLGYYFRKPSIYYSGLIDLGIGHKDYEDRWQNPGDEKFTNVPSFIYPNEPGRDAFYNYSKVNVLRGDHVRLSYINLNYNFNPKLFDSQMFNELQVYFNASNLGIIWKSNKADLDPEFPASIPPAKSWAIGIRAIF